MMKIIWFGFVLAALSAEGDVILSQPGQKVTFDCGINGAVAAVWSHNNSRLIMLRNGFPLRGKGNTAQRSDLKGTQLEIRGVKETDAGMFTCSVGGIKKEHTLLVVTVSSNPSGDLQLGDKATLSCQVNNLKKESTVQWRRPDGSQYPGSRVANLISVTLSDAGQWNCTFSHEGVTYSQGLDIKVTVPAATTPPPVLAPKPKDTNELTSNNNCTTDCLSTLWGIDWWIWAAIGAGCLVVIFLVVLVICVCKRIKRRKRKLHEMQMGCLLLVPKQYCQCECPTAAPKQQQRRRRERPSAPTLQPPPRNDMRSQSEERGRERDR